MSDEWRTPYWLMQFFEGWDDPAQPGRTDGLIREWGDPTYVNPPYSDITPWVRQAIFEAKRGKRVAMLLPHDSSTVWWWILHEAGCLFFAFQGRLRYSETGSARWASVLVLIPRSNGGGGG